MNKKEFNMLNLGDEPGRYNLGDEPFMGDEPEIPTQLQFTFLEKEALGFGQELT